MADTAAEQRKNVANCGYSKRTWVLQNMDNRKSQWMLTKYDICKMSAHKTAVQREQVQYSEQCWYHQEPRFHKLRTNITIMSKTSSINIAVKQQKNGHRDGSSNCLKS